MGQFMREQPPSACRVRRVTAMIENHIAPDRVGDGADRTRRSRGLGVGVDPDVAKTVGEAIFHEGARWAAQRLAGPAQHLVHDRRRVSGVETADGLALQFVLAAFLALRWSLLLRAGAFTLQQQAGRGARSAPVRSCGCDGDGGTGHDWMLRANRRPACAPTARGVVGEAKRTGAARSNAMDRLLNS
jgi:hypothetical protein